MNLKQPILPMLGVNGKMVCDPDYEIISINVHIVFLHMRQLRLVQEYTENQYLLSMDIIIQ